MATLGIVRNIDKLGRIVIPSEYRNCLGIEKLGAVEITSNGNEVILRKYKDKKQCIYCGSEESLGEVKGKCICEKCILDIKSMKE